MWNLTRKVCIIWISAHMNIHSLNKQKHADLIHTWSDKAFKGAVVNLCHVGSLEVKLTQSLQANFFSDQIYLP